ncbi:MAG: DUF2800 domain-containing protein, partial [Myxococcales bacterium]|nr:DUF2800 domain-containing protein [Myxococcales bacterium]
MSPEPKAHSNILSGSIAERRIMCPASLKLENSIQWADSPSDAAALGTACHEAIEWFLNQQEPDFDILLGKEFNGRVIDEGILYDAIVPCVDAFDTLCKDVDWRLRMYEISVDFTPVEHAHGTIDILMCTDDTVYVLDWKFGYSPVYPKGNYQLGFYGAALLHDPRYSHLFATRQKVVLGIIQPTKEVVLDLWETDVTWLHKLTRQLIAAVEPQPNPPAVAGGWCKWCKAQVICDVWQNRAEDFLKTSVEGLDPVTIAEKLKEADELEEFARKIRAYAHDMMFHSHVPVPGWKIVAKESRRRWTNANLVESAIDALGIQAHNKVLLSPAQAERRLGKTRFAALEHLVERKSTGTKLVPATHKGGLHGGVFLHRLKGFGKMTTENNELVLFGRNTLAAEDVESFFSEITDETQGNSVPWLKMDHKTGRWTISVSKEESRAIG